MIPRIYYPSTYQTGDRVTLPKDASHHLQVVLRKRVGDPLILFAGHQMEWEAHITEIHGKKITVTIGKNSLPARVSPLFLHLGQSIGKGEKIEWIIQKAVELGVAAITPIISSRSAFSSLDEARLEKKHQHWRNILIAAVEQCGRTELPLLHPIQFFQPFIHQPLPGQKFLLTPCATQSLSSHSLTQAITLLIGPEGGWSEDEQTNAQQQGFHPIKLGPRILRTETAPIVLLSILQALKGDLLA